MNVLFLLCSGRFHEEDFASQRTKGNLSWIEPKISTKCLTNLRNLNLLKRKSLALSRVLFLCFWGKGRVSVHVSLCVGKGGLDQISLGF